MNVLKMTMATAAAACVLLVLPLRVSSAAPVAMIVARAGVAQPQDIAARNKRKSTPHAPAAAATSTPSATWRGPDPTQGPGIARLRELQRQGRCVIDEGYGRYTFCDVY